MSDVRAIDSSATAYQASLGANPPAQVNSAKGEELFSFNPLWLVVAAALFFAWWLGRRSNRVTPATATAAAAATPAPATASATVSPTPAQPSRFGNWATGWFTPSAAVVETFTKGETEDAVDKLLQRLPTAAVNRTSIKKSVPGIIAKLDQLKLTLDTTLKGLSTTNLDSTNLEEAVTRLTAKVVSVKASWQETEQKRKTAVEASDRHQATAEHANGQLTTLRETNKALQDDNKALNATIIQLNKDIAALTHDKAPSQEASAAKADVLQQTGDKLFTLLEKTLPGNRSGNSNQQRQQSGGNNNGNRPQQTTTQSANS